MMSDSFSSQHNERKTMARLKNIAADIFARNGIDFADAKRAGGWTNATWLADGRALRLSVKPGSEAIRREARLAALLPPDTGYPTVLETGVTEGYEWSFSMEIAGESLGEVWPRLNWNERITALRELWLKAQSVHSVEISAAAYLSRHQAWFNVIDPEQAATQAAGLAHQGILSPRQADVLDEALFMYWTALSNAKCVLNHGDLTLDNALWNEGRVVALLDFEFAVIAPPELDLNELVKCAFGPGETGDPMPDPDGACREQLQRVVTGLAMPVLDHPGGQDLLLGYAILLELWQLVDWLAHPEGEGPLEQWQPYRRLVSLTDGNGGYLAPILGR
jgi:aminoglycoside phosphotransferase